MKTRMIKEFQANEPKFSPEGMSLAIASKKDRRSKKGLDFNCLVLKRGGYEQADEFYRFLCFLKEHEKNIKNNTRLQIIYGHQHHWSVADIQFKDGQFQFFLLDAVNFLNTIFYSILDIDRLFPESKIFFNPSGIQKDGENCGTFSLDHAFCLSKIQDFHEQLHDLKPREENEQKEIEQLVGQYHRQIIEDDYRKKMTAVCKKIRIVSIGQFPDQFGPLLRNTQSIKALNKFPSTLLGNKTITLQKYLSEKKSIKGVKKFLSEDKVINAGILNKRASIRKKTLFFLNQFSEDKCKAIISQHRSYGFFKSNLLNSTPSALDQKEQKKLTSFPESYHIIWSQWKTDINSAIAILKDYSSYNFFRLHWNRGHAEEVKKILETTNQNIPELLVQLEKIEAVKEDGSLDRRIDFIKTMASLNL